MSVASSSSPQPYTTVLHEECFPVDEAPVRSTRSVSWGPHNVLQISTRWHVQLCVATLRRAALRLTVRHHPLCYHPNSATQELVVGATWSATLVPEARYPAEARLCVQTTTCLLVYRIARRGQQTVSASKGVGISFQARAMSMREGGGGGSSSSSTAESRARKGRRRRDSASPSSDSSSSCAASSSEEDELRVLGLPSRRSGARVTGTQATARSRRCTGSMAAAVACQGEARASKERYMQGCGTIVGYEWCADDLLVAVTTTGVFMLPFCNDYSDETEPRLRPLPTPVHVFTSDALGTRATPPSCLTKVLRQSEDNRFTHCDLLVVASVSALRVLHVGVKGVALLHVVQLPQLSSVPSCLCCIASPPVSPDASTHAALLVTTFVSAPTLTARGRFELHLPSHVSSSEPKSARVAPSRAEWVLECVYDLASLHSNDTMLRGFVALALPPPAPDAAWEAWQSGPLLTASSPSSPVAATAEAATWIVLGVARLAIFALLAHAPQAVMLFSCPSLATAVEMPMHAAVGVSGVAVHSSCALALLLLQTGRTRLAPLHLMAVAANDEAGFLCRVLELSNACGTAAGVARDATGATQRRHAVLHELWRRQPSFAFFTWELLFPFDADATALRLYAEAWRQYVAEPSAQVAPTSTLASPHRHIPGHSFRRRYLALRAQFGVELYLRWPMPEREEQLLGRVRATTHDDAMHGRRWVWWQLLLCVWRRCPWDVSCLSELLLANAVTLLAKSNGYAAASLAADERMHAAADAGATNAWQLSPAGAADFVALYVRAQERVLSCQAPSTSEDAAMIAEVKPVGEGGWLAPWCCHDGWVSALRAFLASCHLDASCGPSPATPYACSVCDAREVARLTADFAYTSEHRTTTTRAERHTTVFSCKTFSPLSLYSTEAVVTRCMGCGMWDFAVGPLCRLCGGLL